VIGRKVGKSILECQQWVVCPYRPTRLGAKIFEVPEDCLQPFVSSFLCLVGRRYQPLEPCRELGSDDQNLVGRSNQLANGKRQLFHATSRLTGDDQKATRHQDPQSIRPPSILQLSMRGSDADH
jgi:hypothetical protein